MEKYSKENINLMQGDCMELMASKPNNYYDLAVVDPPYGIGIDGQKEKKNGEKSDRKYHKIKGWDVIPNDNYFNELFRVSKNQIIWGGNYFVKYLTDGHKGWIIWDKGQHGLTMSDCEIAYSSYDYPTRIWIKNRAVLLSEKTQHPTQKPIKLYNWIFHNYAKSNFKILDTHGGSMSSAIAAYYFGCEFDCIELDKDYYNDAVKRFKNQTMQTKLF